MPETIERPSSGAAGAFLRIYWMLLGPIVVVVGAMIVARSDGFSWRDVLPWAAGVFLVVARYVDVTRYGGTTADGEPATTDHAKRFAAMAAAITVGAWLSAHAIRLAFTP